MLPVLPSSFPTRRSSDLIKLDPVRVEMIVMLISPGDMQMPRHHPSGTVIVYTITGKWKYVEHDWIAGPCSVVFETAASEHTPQALAEGGEVLALNIIVGDLVYLDADNRSEEHTSELQSLMRISYAVFCLKKKNTT